MYAVFGMTKSVAMEKAKKTVGACEMRGGEKYFYTKEEYEQKLAEKAEHLFKTMKPVQLSPMYSNKDQAEMYKKIAEVDGGRDLVIRRKDAERNEAGDVIINKLTEKPAKYIWVGA